MIEDEGILQGLLSNMFHVRLAKELGVGTWDLTTKTRDAAGRHRRTGFPTLFLSSGLLAGWRLEPAVGWQRQVPTQATSESSVNSGDEWAACSGPPAAGRPVPGPSHLPAGRHGQALSAPGQLPAASEQLGA